MKEAIEVDLPPLELAAAGFEAADVEQPLHQSRERLRLLSQRRADLALFRVELAINIFLQQLEVSDDDVDRSLELVRCDRYEFSLELVELRELRCHSLITLGESSEFVAPVFLHRQPMSEIAVGDSLHSFLEIVHGPT